MKYTDFKRYKFSTAAKKFNALIYNFKKFFKYFDLTIFDSKKIFKLLNFRRYSLYRIKEISFFSSKYLLFHIPAAIIFFGFLYLFIPTFYKYDKSYIEKTICKKANIECLIKGKINYSFYPTPRIKIKNLVIKDFIEKKNTLITSENTEIILSFKNLLAEDKHKYKEIKLNNFKINFNLKKIKRYKNFFTKEINIIPINFKKGEIILFDDENYIATINEARIDLKFLKDSINGTLKGKFLNDNIYVDLIRKKIDEKISTDLILKMSNTNFLAKAHFDNSTKEKRSTTGNFLVKKDKNKMTAIFDYKNNELLIKKSNLRNSFLDGKMEGKITFLPFFNFDLDLNLNSINFTKLYNLFLSLSEEEQKKFFKINKKINGKLNLFSDKIYSSYNLIKSLESRLKFYNGNMPIEQLLLNFGKLGAADVLGAINNEKKFTNFKFETNVFIDNQKKFLSKFGIYNKDAIPSNIFISGNFDTENIRMSLYEISNIDKSNLEDINFVENEFNDLMLEDGYKKLFYFPKFKEFIKSVTSEDS